MSPHRTAFWLALTCRTAAGRGPLLAQLYHPGLYAAEYGAMIGARQLPKGLFLP